MSCSEPERLGQRALPNGDIYEGEHDSSLPHGRGKYTWSDGTLYDGEWEKNKIIGRGRLLWPSGASYEGDFCGGFMHGFGTFHGHDGSIYEGCWRMNIQHGLGTKTYNNSDVYDGFWKEGLQEGVGKYTWSNGDIYIGNWKAGKMSGRGVMKWANGDVFDGFWLDGLQHGPGYYKFPDGAYYFGTWSRGLKDGRGIFCPVGPNHHYNQNFHDPVGYYDKVHSFRSTSSVKSDEPRKKKSSFKSRSLRIWSTNGNFRDSDRASTSYDSSFSPSQRSTSRGSSRTMSCSSDEIKDELETSTVVVYEREYMQGVLVMERERTYSAGVLRKRRWQMFSRQRRGPGETIYKGHRSYYLMLNLQLGIRYTVGKITPVPMREVRASDFGHRARIRMHFPSKGSQLTPPHNSIDFYWKDYCPMVFRNLREMFKIDAADYMMSICGGDGLKELSSPGKSGSIFYLSQDERFVIKTLRKNELKILLKMLPNYYNHVGSYDNTLITKFFGLHRLTVRGGRKIRFVVMGNMFWTELRIHCRYDLKGSSQGRSTEKHKVTESTTLKDLDLSYVFHLEKSWRDSLFRQISLDCKFLQSQSIIDYSMLLGLHFRAPEHLKPLLESQDTVRDCASSLTNTLPLSSEAVVPPKGLLLVTHEPTSVSHVPGSHIRGSTLRAAAFGNEEVDLLLPGTGRLRVQLGVNMPAQANRKLLHEGTPDSAEVDVFEVYDVVLYLGIIDILQEYNMTKKIEHACKSLKFDPMSISAVEPKLYSSRFISFLEKVFPETI